MQNELVISTGPTTEPISLEKAKSFFREDRNVEDDLITGMITAARKMLERKTGYVLMETEFKLYLKDFPSEDVKIPKLPFKSGSLSIEYIDTDSATQTLAGANYTLHEQGKFPAIEFHENLPELDDSDGARWRVIITFIAGYGTNKSDIPKEWVNAVSLLAFMLWQREPGDPNPLNDPVLNSYLVDYHTASFV